MSDMWLPEGPHYDLNIEHKPLEGSGPFTGGGWKMVWHTTESERESVDAMYGVLKAKRAAPHFVIGWRKGYRFPVVIQMLALDEGARALAHPSGPETNRANCIQVEVCGRAASSHEWEDNWYRALANLSILVGHRVEIPESRPRRFPGNRYSGWGFVKAQGHVGHCHVPGNDHWDPGKFAGSKLIRYIKAGRHQLEPR